MKICIISVGVVGLPVPAVRGGAVENLKSALLHVYLKGKCHSIIEANRARGLYFSINRYGKDFRSALVPKRKEKYKFRL